MLPQRSSSSTSSSSLLALARAVGAHSWRGAAAAAAVFGVRAFGAAAAADGSDSSAAAAQAARASRWGPPAVCSPSPGVHQASVKLGGRQWTFETGRLAGLAHGSCLVTAGDTSVLAAVVGSRTAQPEADGVPLQVEYRERLSAAGRLPLRPDRRERPGSEREVLAGRLIDRALRPLLPPGFLYETQVWCQVLAADGSVDPEIVALNAASAALLLAPGVPFTHPVGAVRVCRMPGKKATLLNPAHEFVADAHLALTFAGSPHKAMAIEAAARQASNALFASTLRFAAKATAPLIQAQLALAAAAADSRPQQDARQPALPLLWPSQQLQQTVAQLMEQPLRQLFSHEQHDSSSSPGGASGPAQRSKHARAAALAALQAQLLSDLERLGLLPEAAAGGAAAQAASAGMGSRDDALRAFDLLQSRVMRQLLLEQGGRRVDGRAAHDVRAFSAEAGVLPRVVHGSGLFTRGETQSLATATVGHDTEVAPLETLTSRRSRSRLHLHYSFPAFSVAEVGKAGPPNRREVGHGNLARTGLAGLLPAEDDFPFTVRVTADTLSSSGSSSMAAVCAGSLALAAAGVPMRALAAGVSVGLVTAQPPQLASARGAAAGSAGGGGSSSSSSDSHSWPELDDASYSRWLVQPAHSSAVQQEQAAGDASSDGDSGGSSSDDDVEAADSAADSSGPSGSEASSSTGAQLLPSSYGPALLLTDIQGIEDHLGDMDFKIAGTAHSITAVQLDTKLPGVDLSLLEAALAPASAARKRLLAAMEEAISSHVLATDAVDAPQYGSVQIMKELVPRLIGPQGSTLLEIEEGCGASLLVDDTGTVSIYAPSQLRYQHAVAAVQEVEGRGVTAGEVYRVRVLRVVDFGAYVALPNGLPALLHISELSHDKVREVRDVVAEGQEFEVLCKGRDAKGFVKLSLKDMLPKPPQEEPRLAAEGVAAAAGGGGASGSGTASGAEQQAGAAAGGPPQQGSGDSGGTLAQLLASVGRSAGGAEALPAHLQLGAVADGPSAELGRQRVRHVHHQEQQRAGGPRPRALVWRPPQQQKEQQQGKQQGQQQEQQEPGQGT